MSRKLYKDPPLAELVCAFHFSGGGEWDATIPGLVYRRVADTFPNRKTSATIQTKIDAAQEGGVRQEFRIAERARFSTNEENAFMQIGTDFLAVNHLPPYEGWHTFAPLIENAFQAYCAEAEPKGISKLGLRYINHVDIPETTFDLTKFFNLHPTSNLDGQASNFHVSIDIPMNDMRDILRVQLTTGPEQEPGAVRLILDIDHFLAKPEAIDPAKALKWIDDAHSQANAAFEQCITDELRAIFGQISNATKNTSR